MATELTDEQVPDGTPLGDTENIPAPEAPNEAIDRAALEPDGTYQEVAGDEPEEDPDAWRTWRVSDDPAELLRKMEELENMSPAFKRALHGFASPKVRNESRQKELELAERAEKAERRALELAVQVGERHWGSMTRQQIFDSVNSDPQAAASFENFKKARQLLQNQQPATPQWMRTMEADGQGLIDRWAAHIPEDVETQFRDMLRDPEIMSDYASRPQRFLIDLNEAIATRIQNGHTSPQQVDATPRQPVPVQNGSGPRNTSPANPGIGKNLPEQTPRRGGGTGVSRTYTEAEYSAMGPAGRAKLLQAAGASHAGELFRRGIVTRA